MLRLTGSDVFRREKFRRSITPCRSAFRSARAAADAGRIGRLFDHRRYFATIRELSSTGPNRSALNTNYPQDRIRGLCDANEAGEPPGQRGIRKEQNLPVAGLLANPDYKTCQALNLH